MTEALEQAKVSIADDAMSGRDYLAIYDTLIWPNVERIKVHRYWFSFTTRGQPAIFNILWDAADIVSRTVHPDEE
jgi:hypothetical protein